MARYLLSQVLASIVQFFLTVEDMPCKWMCASSEREQMWQPPHRFDKLAACSVQAHIGDTHVNRGVLQQGLQGRRSTTCHI